MKYDHLVRSIAFIACFFWTATAVSWNSRGHGYPIKTTPKRKSIYWAPSFRKGFPFDYCHSRQSFIQHPFPVQNKPIETSTFHLTPQKKTKKIKPLGKSHHSSEAGLLKILRFPTCPSLPSFVVWEESETVSKISNLPFPHSHIKGRGEVPMTSWLWWMESGFYVYILNHIYTFYWWHPIEMIDDDVVQYDYTTNAAVLRMMLCIFSFCCISLVLRHLFCNCGDMCSDE